MSCATCGSNMPSGCGNKGHCQNGGCNKMNTYDWFSANDIHDAKPYDIVEISFKNGSSKGFFKNKLTGQVQTGDMVVVDTGSGYDVGQISLLGELVRLQVKKKKAKVDRIRESLVRPANARDLERMREARAKELESLPRAKSIARSMGINLKMGDIQFQADLRKATFFYTAEGRIDFRELVKAYAAAFRVKIEMRQIGSRQESARIGGIGSCGRELCCSTWLSDFKSVNTSAARYQNLALNQVKLSGQCGRLKCCLNYELDTYVDLLKEFPMHANKIKTKHYTASLIKADIFRDVMHFSFAGETGRNTVISLPKARVFEIWEMNKLKKYPETFMTEVEIEQEQEKDFAKITGFVELKEEKKRGRNRSNRRKKGKKPTGQTRNKKRTYGQDRDANKEQKDGKKDTPQGPSNSNNRKRKSRNKNRNWKGKNQNGNNTKNTNKKDKQDN